MTTRRRHGTVTGAGWGGMAWDGTGGTGWVGMGQDEIGFPDHNLPLLSGAPPAYLFPVLQLHPTPSCSSRQSSALFDLILVRPC